jgi:protein gp37
MSDQSKIEWTEATWNPVRGCTKISPGCKNCYAETFAERWRGIPGHPYEQGFDLRLVPEKLGDPLRWQKPRRIFVNSMSDLFHEDVPFDYIDKAFAVMAVCKRHTFQVLTKRVDRMRKYIQSADGREIKFDIPGIKLNREPFDWPLPNVWLGFSAENQKYFDERAIHAAPLMRDGWLVWVSAEPLLGPIKMQHEYDAYRIMRNWLCDKGIRWVVVGGESGHGARPCDLDWIRSIVGQCERAKVACFVKQLGAEPIQFCGQVQHGLDCRVPLKLVHSKGGDMSEWPADLRVRQYPEAA